MRFESTTAGVIVFAGLFAIVFVRFGFLQALLTLVSIVMHELAHAAACRYFGCNVKALGISHKGMYLRREISGSRWAESVIAAAGPFMNFFLALLLPGWARTANLLLSAFNLLPFKGFDGYRIFRRPWEKVTAA